MVTGMWHVMEPQEKRDTYSCSNLAHCIRVCIHWQAKLSFFKERNRDVAICFAYVAQDKTLLEGAELLSDLTRGIIHTEWERGFSKLV